MPISIPVVSPARKKTGRLFLITNMEGYATAVGIALALRAGRSLDLDHKVGRFERCFRDRRLTLNGITFERYFWDGRGASQRGALEPGMPTARQGFALSAQGFTPGLSGREWKTLNVRTLERCFRAESVLCQPSPCVYYAGAGADGIRPCGLAVHFLHPSRPPQSELWQPCWLCANPGRRSAGDVERSNVRTFKRFFRAMGLPCPTHSASGGDEFILSNRLGWPSTDGDRRPRATPIRQKRPGGLNISVFSVSLWWKLIRQRSRG
jgi:hypothetical protein